MKNSLIFILKRFLKKNAIKIDEAELEFQLLSHPSYPSLHSLTGVLNHFNIENLALEIPCNEESFNQLPESFIAYIKDEKGDDLILAIKTNYGIQVIFDNQKKTNLTVDEFLEIWTGIIVVIEKDDDEVKKNKRTINFTIGATLLVLITVFSSFFSFKPTLFQSLHFLLSFVGLAIASVIVKHELGFQSVIADKFCSGNFTKINCDEVLKSKASSFWKILNLSDVGIVYFLTLIFSWLLIVIGNAGYGLLVLISVLAVPFTFYSIIYQSFIIKKWCPLCLSIMLILWLQASVLYFVNFKILIISNSIFSLQSILLIILSFFLSIALWQFILPKLKKEQELNKLKIEHYKFKRNYSIFHALISQSDPINTDIHKVNEITFGENDSPLKVVVITNPLCGFCKDAHNLVKELLDAKNSKIQVTIRFNVSLNTDSIDTKIALKLLELYNSDNEQKCLKAMHGIYGTQIPKNWFEIWGENKGEKYMDILQKEKKWCKENNINFTPEILVNGKSFPREYDRPNLLYFIDDLIEETEQETELTVSEVENTEVKMK